MKRLLKFLHTIGAIGLMGAMACLLVLLGFATSPQPLPAYVLLTAAMGRTATWVYLPSMALTLFTGLAAIGINRAFHNAGWAWAKLATGLLMFEWSLAGIVQPLRSEAERAAAMLGPADAALIADAGDPIRNSIWVLLAVAAANVVLGVWRPRLTRLPD
ncbi:MAG: hypothetical protein AB7I36_17425 [Rhodospirillaceae bacterium]